jgi:hypothetical protein
MKRAEELLSGKTLPLEHAAVELLRSLRPMDPAKDWSKLLDFLDQEQGYLRIIFRQYTSSEGTGDLDLLGQNPWRQFCKDTRLLDKKAGVSKQTIDTIFVRANRDNADDVLTGTRAGEKRPGGIDATDRDLLLRVQPGREEWRGETQGDAKHLRQPEFVAALVRCAYSKFAPTAPSLHQQVRDESALARPRLATSLASDLLISICL